MKFIPHGQLMVAADSRRGRIVGDFLGVGIVSSAAPRETDLDILRYGVRILIAPEKAILFGLAEQMPIVLLPMLGVSILAVSGNYLMMADRAFPQVGAP